MKNFTDWEKIFPKHVTDKDYIQNIQKTLKAQEKEKKQPS